MKKLFITLALISVTAFSLQAQLRFGLKGGVNVSTLSGDAADDLKSMTGYYVGPTVELSIPVIGLGVDGSVLYSQKGIKSDADDKKMGYIEVPVSLKYKFFDLPGLNKIATPFIEAGPYASFKISGKLDDIENAEAQLKAKTFGAGLNFGLGVELLGRLQIRGAYSLGLTDSYAAGDWSVKDRTWQIGASVFF
jgi:hypothetical protein